MTITKNSCLWVAVISDYRVAPIIYITITPVDFHARLSYLHATTDVVTPTYPNC